MAILDYVNAGRESEVGGVNHVVPSKVAFVNMDSYSYIAQRVKIGIDVWPDPPQVALVDMDSYSYAAQKGESNIDVWPDGTVKGLLFGTPGAIHCFALRDSEMFSAHATPYGFGRACEPRIQPR